MDNANYDEWKNNTFMALIILSKSGKIKNDLPLLISPFFYQNCVLIDSFSSKCMVTVPTVPTHEKNSGNSNLSLISKSTLIKTQPDGSFYIPLVTQDKEEYKNSKQQKFHFDGNTTVVIVNNMLII